MILPPDSALLQIPEFLVQEKSDADSLKEILEQLDPNSVNISAALVDKLVEDLPSMNSWENLENYISEFKLSEIFEGLEEDFYSVKRSELLKGFFTFKGTRLDLAYIMRVAGYTLQIFDAEALKRGASLWNVLYDLYPGEFDTLLRRLDQKTLDAFFTRFLEYYLDVILVNNKDPFILNNTSSMMVVNEGEETSSHILTGLRSDVHKLDNISPLVLDNSVGIQVVNVGSDYVNKTIIKVNNISQVILDNEGGLKVVNLNTANESLLTYGIDLTPNQIEKLFQAISLWRLNLANAKALDSDLDCTLSAELTIDMDSDKFKNRGFLAANVLRDIRQLMEYRLLVCVYVRSIAATLKTKDLYSRDKRVEVLEFTQESDIFEVAPSLPEDAVELITAPAVRDTVESHLFPADVIPTIKIGFFPQAVVNNLFPHSLPGRSEKYLQYSFVYEKVGAHVTLVVDNEDYYRLPGDIAIFNDHYNPEYPAGVSPDFSIKINNIMGMKVVGDRPALDGVILSSFKTSIINSLGIEEYSPYLIDIFAKDVIQERFFQEDAPSFREASLGLVSFQGFYPEYKDKPLEDPSITLEVQVRDNIWNLDISDSDIEVSPTSDSDVEKFVGSTESSVETLWDKDLLSDSFLIVSIDSEDLGYEAVLDFAETFNIFDLDFVPMSSVIGVENIEILFSQNSWADGTYSTIDIESQDVSSKEDVSSLELDTSIGKDILEDAPSKREASLASIITKDYSSEDILTQTLEEDISSFIAENEFQEEFSTDSLSIQEDIHVHKENSEELTSAEESVLDREITLNTDSEDILTQTLEEDISSFIAENEFQEESLHIDLSDSNIDILISKEYSEDLPHTEEPSLDRVIDLDVSSEDILTQSFSHNSNSTLDIVGEDIRETSSGSTESLATSIEVILPSTQAALIAVGASGVIYNGMPVALSGNIPSTSSYTNITLIGSS